jgi:hypothetical protein
MYVLKAFILACSEFILLTVYSSFLQCILCSAYAVYAVRVVNSIKCMQRGLHAFVSTGAAIAKRWTDKVTHVVFKGGLYMCLTFFPLSLKTALHIYIETIFASFCA